VLIVYGHGVQVLVVGGAGLHEGKQRATMVEFAIVEVKDPLTHIVPVVVSVSEASSTVSATFVHVSSNTTEFKQTQLSFSSSGISGNQSATSICRACAPNELTNWLNELFGNLNHKLQWMDYPT
jgi:hypothetical protein